MNKKFSDRTMTSGSDTRKHHYSMVISRDASFLDEICEQIDIPVPCMLHVYK